MVLTPAHKENYAQRIAVGAGPAGRLKVDKGPILTIEEAQKFENAMRRCAATTKGSEERLVVFAETFPTLLKGYNAAVKDPNLTDNDRIWLSHIGKYIAVISKEVDEALASPERNMRMLGFKVYAEAGTLKKILNLAKDHESADVRLAALDYIMDELRKCVLEGGNVQRREQLKDLLVDIASTGTYTDVRDKTVDYLAMGYSSTGKRVVIDPATGNFIEDERTVIDMDRERLIEVAKRTKFKDTQRRVFALIRTGEQEIDAIDKLAKAELPRFLAMLCPGYKAPIKPEPPPPSAGGVELGLFERDAPQKKPSFVKKPPPFEQAAATA